MKNPKSPSKSRGFTLVELMMVVAILGVLATVSVYVYGRYIKKARASEVPEVFGEFLIKQEVFHAEMGRYIGAPAGEDAFWPTTISQDRNDITAMARPAYWTQLRFKTSKTSLYCQYVAVAGPAGDASNRGAEGATLWAAAAIPISDWFYLRARCDLDGNAALNSHYMQRGDRTVMFKEDEGR